MNEKSIFVFNSYKPILRQYLRAKGKRGALSRAAEALNCQRSYLSRVMNSELHLTPDQAFMLARFWKLPHQEREYFQLLVEHERASTREYKEELQAQKLRNDTKTSVNELVDLRPRTWAKLYIFPRGTGVRFTS
jgi:plasmid maintenance system antidote protein VapI